MLSCGGCCAHMWLQFFFLWDISFCGMYELWAWGLRWRGKESSIDIGVNKTIYYYYYYYYFFIKIFCIEKKTQALFKYLNTPKKHNKAHKQLSFRCKAINFLFKYFFA